MKKQVIDPIDAWEAEQAALNARSKQILTDNAFEDRDYDAAWEQKIAQDSSAYTLTRHDFEV